MKKHILQHCVITCVLFSLFRYMCTECTPYIFIKLDYYVIIFSDHPSEPKKFFAHELKTSENFGNF